MSGRTHRFVEPLEPIRVSIGSEPRCWLCAEVLKSSIVRRTERTAVFSESWTQRLKWHPLMDWGPNPKRGTRFSKWRWVVPQLYGFKGKAIYLDSDQVVLADIAELWNALPAGKAIAAVCNVNGNDWWGYPNTIVSAGKRYKDKIQTSVMVMDCVRCDWDFPYIAKKNSYADLMQGEFIDRAEVAELDPQWNRFGRCDKGTKLLHWSHVATQPQKNPAHPTAHIFRAELEAAIEAGHVRPEDVNEEIDRGHVHDIYRQPV